MPAALTMPLRHARARTLALLTSPADLALLAVATASSLFAWDLLVRGVAYSREPRLIAILSLATLSWWLWPWLLVRPLSGGRVAAGQQWHRTLPMPALPIGLRGRLLAEALAGLLLVLVARMTLGYMLLVSRAGSSARFWSNVHSLMVDVPWSLAAAAITLPVLLAWLAPARSEGAYVSRPLLAAVLAVAILVALPRSETLGGFWLRAGLVGAGLSVVVLAAFVRVEARSSEPVPLRGPLTRPALEPAACFRRDVWRRALRPLRLSVGCGLSLLFGGLLLRSAGGIWLPGHSGIWLLGHFLSAVAAFVVLARVWALPLGVSVFATDALASSRSLFGGAYARAWASLPVRPEAVRRAVYLHGLASAALVVLVFAAHTQLVAALGLGWWSWRGDLVLALAVPCAAGFLLCAAVGDRLRGTLSAAAMLSIPPAHLVALKGLGFERLSPGAHVTLLAALVLLGSLPPLVHLRRHSSPAPGAAPKALPLLLLVILLPLGSSACSGGDPLCVVPAHDGPVERRPPAAAVDVADPVWMRCTEHGPRPAEAPAIASLRQGEDDADRQPPRPIHTPQPCYPEAAFQAGVQGVVEVELLIAEDGTVTEAGVVRSIPELDAAALDSICRWRFVPAEEEGRAVPHVARAPFSFGIH